MASPKHLLVAFAVCSSLLLISPPPAIATPSPLVNSVCNGAAITDRQFCLNALSTPNATSAKNPIDLMKVVMELASTVAKDISREITLAIPLHAKNPAAFPALNRCLTTLNAEIHSFSMVVREMEEDPLSASYNSKLTGDQVGDCETALALAHVDLPKVTTANESLKKFVSIAFEAANRA